jgi:hypothetical protein
MGGEQETGESLIIRGLKMGGRSLPTLRPESAAFPICSYQAHACRPFVNSYFLWQPAGWVYLHRVRKSLQ